jgi:hypothetical protein
MCPTDLRRPRIAHDVETETVGTAKKAFHSDRLLPAQELSTAALYTLT